MPQFLGTRARAVAEREHQIAYFAADFVDGNGVMSCQLAAPSSTRNVGPKSLDHVRYTAGLGP
jgi:hypothetical protein